MEENTFNKHDFRNILRKNMAEATSSRRDEIDVLRTAIWFAEIKSRLNASSAYEVERILEPNAFGKNKDGDSIHRNKWSKYEVGKHVPSNVLVTQVDAKLPGTKRLLNHVLWAALQAKLDLNENTDSLLRQLAPDVQKIIFHADRHIPEGSSHRVRLSLRQLKMLERRAGIDALACLTIYTREASDHGMPDQILDLGTSLYRVLLILNTIVPIRDFALDILGIYRKRIFSQIRYGGLKLHVEDADFLDAVRLLNTLLLSLEDNYKIGIGWNDSIRAMYQLLNGGYGFHIQFALAPLICPDGPLTDANAKDYCDFERQKRFQIWGKEQISSGRREILPPQELW